MMSVIFTFAIFAIIIIVVIVITLRKNKFKKTVLSKVIADAFPNSTYEPTKSIDRDTYKSIGALRSGIHFRGSDLLKGKTKGGSDFWYSEIYTYNKSDKTNITVFKGGIFAFKLNKSFNHAVYICSRKFKTYESFHHPKAQKMETENAEFNNTFRIYAEDLETAFYLCTPQIMEKMIEINHTQKNGIIISFKDNYIYIAIPYLNLFKTPIFFSKSSSNIKKFTDRAKEDIGKFDDFIDKFKLDSRLFS